MSVVFIGERPNPVVRAGDGPGILYNRDPSRPLYIGSNTSILEGNFNSASILDPMSSVYVGGDTDVWACAPVGTDVNDQIAVDFIHAGRSQHNTSPMVLKESIDNVSGTLGPQLESLLTQLETQTTVLQTIATLLAQGGGGGGTGGTAGIVIAQADTSTGTVSIALADGTWEVSGVLIVTGTAAYQVSVALSASMQMTFTEISGPTGSSGPATTGNTAVVTGPGSFTGAVQQPGTDVITFSGTVTVTAPETVTLTVTFTQGTGQLVAGSYIMGAQSQ